RRVGTLSYSLYLMHTTVIYLLQEWTPWHPVLRGAVALGLSLLLASLIYRFIEQPCARLRKKLSRSTPAPGPHWSESGAAHLVFRHPENEMMPAVLSGARAGMEV